MLGRLICSVVFVLATASVVVAESAAPPASAPPRFDLEVFLDANKMELPVVVPGQLGFQHWQGMVSTAVAMHFKRDAGGHLPTQFRQYGDINLHLIEGKLDVEFADETQQPLHMKTGDVASWGNLSHRIACRSDECRLLIFSTPVLWQELGPDGGNPVPLYVDSAYYATHGRQ
ncbi:MAG: hypothetical protein J4A00_07385 [Gammaproteobacteria bacterium]|nr:hypothetical protein [Gammaproteobacteria bacterium]